jgi:hypothetical protein
VDNERAHLLAVRSLVGKKDVKSSLLVLCVVLGFELRAYTLSHSTSSFCVMGFF